LIKIPLHSSYLSFPIIPIIDSRFCNDRQTHNKDVCYLDDNKMAATTTVMLTDDELPQNCRSLAAGSATGPDVTQRAMREARRVDGSLTVRCSLENR
jgi:hypothetical protein